MRIGRYFSEIRTSYLGWRLESQEWRLEVKDHHIKQKEAAETRRHGEIRRDVNDLSYLSDKIIECIINFNFGLEPILNWLYGLEHLESSVTIWPPWRYQGLSMLKCNSILVNFFCLSCHWLWKAQAVSATRCFLDIAFGSRNQTLVLIIWNISK